VPPSGGGNF
jgi:hypothetical protein